MNEKLLQAAKHALEFIQAIDGYENSRTANELRQAIEAAEQSVQSDAIRFCACGKPAHFGNSECFECFAGGRGE